jgi:uncharacterized UPF0146 family protein
MFNIDNISRRTNLEENDSLSGYMGHAAQQNHNVYEVFYNFLNEIKPKRILEIGTALGGFTSYLNIISKEGNLNIEILSYDIYRRDWYDEMISEGIDVRVEDIFNSDFSSVNNEVIDFIKRDGITLILCDGGYKIGEFNVLSNYLKIDDFIMAHDYSFDNEKFNKDIKNKIWNWCEITESDIHNACVRNNLISYNQEIFDSVVWVCKQKK